MATAFQPNGFQLNAFQIAIEDLYAFQKCAFQFGAFQVEQCDAEWVYYPAPRGPGVSVRAAFSTLAYRNAEVSQRALYSEDTMFRVLMAELTTAGREEKPVSTTHDVADTLVEYAAVEEVVRQTSTAEKVPYSDMTIGVNRGKDKKSDH